MSDFLHIKMPIEEGKVLLHTCCAPCSGAIIECLLNNGIRPTVFYSNSNIYPLKEYETRRDECIRYAEYNGLKVVEDKYDHNQWKCMIKGLEDEPERGRRCLQCFRFPLLRLQGGRILSRSIQQENMLAAFILMWNGGLRTGEKAGCRSVAVGLSKNRIFIISSIAGANSVFRNL